MTTYSTALPCSGTSMTADIRADVSAVARVDKSGWDVSYSLYLIATNSSGFPFSNGANTGTLDVGGTRRISWSGTFNFPSGHGAGYTISLGSGSYFLPVTGTGDGNLAVDWAFTEAGSPTIGSGSGSNTYTLPSIRTAPTAPTSLVATRVSDTQTGLVWTRNPSTIAPYVSQEVFRVENGGTPIDVIGLSGTADSYTATTVANRKYTFNVEARNTAGVTRSAASNIILTTPAKLASITGAKVSGGIKLTLSKLDVPYTEVQILVEVTSNGGSSWATSHTFDATDLSTTASTEWTDTSAPSSGTVQYRATVKTNGGTQGVLSSPVTVSNIMVLNVPPLAPTNLTPSGIVDVVAPVTLAWSHVASSDGAAQSSRQIQYSTDSGATQTDIVVGNSTDQAYAWTVSTGSFTPGQTIQWRVRTAGSQPGTYGAWSEWQTITLRQSLSVAVTAPSGTWTGGDAAVTWTTTPAWGSASQVAYRIVMSSSSGVAYDSGSVVSGTLSGVVPASAQRNLTDYTIGVYVTDNYNLTAVVATTTISTDFLAPGPVVMTWVYDDDLGQLVFTPEFSEETSSALDDTVSWMLEQSFDQSTWNVIGSYPNDSPVADPFVRVGATSWYRSTGYTSLGVAGEQTVFEIPPADVKSRWGRISFGDNFGSTVRFGWSQTVEMSSGRSAETYDTEGADYPIVIHGRSRSKRYAVSGKLLFKQSAGSAGIADSLCTSSVDDFDVLGTESGVCLFRDPDGAWWSSRVSDVKVTRSGPHLSGQPDTAAVSFTVERVTR